MASLMEVTANVLHAKNPTGVGSGWILVVESKPGRRLCPVRSLPFPRIGDDVAENAQDGALSRPRAVLVEASRGHEDGLSALESLRAAGLLGTVPTFVAAQLEVVRALDDAPFDDFVVPPYTHEELYARVRRAEARWKARPPNGTIEEGALRIDLASQSVSAAGEPVVLTRREYGLLVFLYQNPNVLFSRSQILERVWGHRTKAGPRTVDIHVRRIRVKLAAIDFPLETVRGSGYRLRRDTSPSPG